ncbi:SH3 domain-containing protein [Mesorhizobium sp. NBSH29]|uniref:SH3 domain-containing protein n=1 Tax=Mesorhizobium sp. NBSH29 TaxID=2654249 RepID=UPI0018BF9A9A|nr:SH3 domain-containing protein [Mesorhizobium sp. NBSH29]QPC87580.1 SH3 domain-containing protein [Mesorhizobium sp. NBSH29]
MAGFVFPKLRWLLVGAVAAGGWAATQEPVAKRAPPASQRAAISSPAPTSGRAERPVRSQPAASASTNAKQTRTDSPSPSPSPPSAPRPSALVTASIKKPDSPAAQEFYTVSRVRMREDASRQSRMLTWLEQGAMAKVLERSGKWRRVVVGGQAGWVHGDYLALPDPKAPRPNAPVEHQRTIAAAKPASSEPAKRPSLPSLFQSGKPARKAQTGDCQCPYDLMINGKQCGDNSAYKMRGRAKEACYL